MSQRPLSNRITPLKRYTRPEQPEVRLCVDCDHVHFGGVSDLIEICRHPANLGPQDLVEGRSQSIHTPQELRSHGGKCGPEGIWWKPRVTFWRWVRRLFG